MHRSLGERGGADLPEQRPDERNTFRGTHSPDWSDMPHSFAPCHRALAARAAISFRLSAVREAARAAPPFFPPSFPRATA
jgi:hypothetical protein